MADGPNGQRTTHSARRSQRGRPSWVAPTNDLWIEINSTYIPLARRSSGRPSTIAFL